MTDTTYKTIKDIWRAFTADEKIDVTYRSFLNWFAKLELNPDNLDAECIAKLDQYCTLREATNINLFKNASQKVALLTEIYPKFTNDENGVKVMDGKEFQKLLIDRKFVSRTQIYEKCKAVKVQFSTSSPITLGDARKVITGISN